MKKEGYSISAPGGKIIIANSVDSIFIKGKDYPRPAEHLPYRAINFVGRKEILDELISLLENTNIIGICAIKGLGGIGKTALAAELAHLLDKKYKYPGGVLWGDLGSYNAGEIALQWMENYGYDLSKLDSNTRMKRLSSFLAEFNTLLVLDNAKSTQDIKNLLFKKNDIPIIITTRDRKTIPIGVKVFNLLQMEVEESMDILRAFTSDSYINNNLADAIDICNLCGNLPIALTIAGSQLQNDSFSNSASMTDIKQKLCERKLELLSKGEDPTSNIIMSFDNSYEQLDAQQKDVFNLFGIFNGPTFSSNAISFALGLKNEDVQKIIEELVNLSLVYKMSKRYRVHDLIREYSNNKLNQSCAADMLDELKINLLEYYSLFIEEHHRDYRVLDGERLNIFGLLDYNVENTQWEISLINIGKFLTEYLKARGLWNEAYQLGEAAFNYAEKHSLIELQAELATRNLSWVSYFHGDIQKAYYWANLGIKLYSSLGLDLEKAYASRRFAMVLIENTDFEKAKQILENALLIFKKFHRLDKVGDTLTILGYLYRKQGNYTKSESYLFEALPIVHEINDKKEISMTLYNIARLRNFQGQKKEALDIHFRSLKIDEELNRTPGIAWNLLRISQIEFESGTQMNITEKLERSQALFENMGVTKYNSLISSMLLKMKNQES